MLGLAGVYFATAQLGLAMATLGGVISPVWPPTGVALAALLVRGPILWPGVFVGACLATASTGLPWPVLLGIATGNTLMPTLGALLARRLRVGVDLSRIRDVVILSAGAGAVCSIVSALLGPVSLTLGGALPRELLASGVWVWWVGDLTGVLVVAPSLLLLSRPSWPRRPGEAVALAALTTGLGASIFLFPGLQPAVAHAASFLLFPMSALAALRFGPRGAATVSLALSVVAIIGTVRGQGPFASGSTAQDLLVLQLFIVVNAVTAQLLAAASEERQRAVERLQLLATTVRGVHEGVFIAEVLGPGMLRTVFANEALGLLMGCAQDSLVGKDPCLMYGEQDARLRHRVRAAVLAGESLCVEVTVTREDGRVVSTEVLLSPVRATGGGVTHFVATHRDITATKELQARLVAAERVAAVGTLAAGVGHEINNPLAYLVLNLEAASRGLSEGGLLGIRDAQASVRGALEGAERIRLIVRDLQVFSRQGDQERTLLDLNALVPPAVRIVSHALRHRARLVEEFGPVPRVMGSEARLGQVLLNLLVNAMQAIPEGNPALHEVRVRTSTDASGRARVDVVDTGVGIPEQVLPRIFEPFFTTKPTGEGTGLGLAICQQIIRTHGGELTVRSEAGKGSVFTVLLPAAPVQVEVPPRPSARGMTAPAPSSGRRGRVLVVDDEPRLAQSMRLLLEPYHDVVTTMRGGEALALLAAGHHFDVILCDLQMPETDGATLYRRLSVMAPELTRRVVFISGGAYTPETRMFIETVPNLVLEKPVRPEVLMASVDAALDSLERERAELDDEDGPVARAGGARH
ncbi:MASE1 domain-containing protein [Myxococcus stipitatus]|uniref:MASE1 domain-containing protein n=1 Tax=Myxococcus stipitatus TaxID=83455 RepID=UPI001F3AF0BF|nr:MASE1 domain-containing protein [Myxococcus stipitatus]MCE9670905.1 MASE1 domain-containing protein [Myxococcus stipitatus]